MDKNITKGCIILGILFVLVSIIVFAVPNLKTGTVWITYAFTAVAFVVQIGIWKSVLGKKKTLKSKFRGFTIVHIGIIYLFIQTAVFAIFMFVPTLPIWSAIVVCTIVLGISAVCMIAADVGWKESERVEAKVEKKVLYIKMLQVDIELLTDSENDVDVKNALMQLAEKIHFSDPMSNEASMDLEDKILAKVEELKSAINKSAIILELNMLLDERNEKCKILK